LSLFAAAVFVTNLPAQDFLDQVGETLSFRRSTTTFARG
jgi:hypothetical protein